jgi:hypothetical protein
MDMACLFAIITLSGGRRDAETAPFDGKSRKIPSVSHRSSHGTWGFHIPNALGLLRTEKVQLYVKFTPFWHLIRQLAEPSLQIISISMSVLMPTYR